MILLKIPLSSLKSKKKLKFLSVILNTDNIVCLLPTFPLLTFSCLPQTDTDRRCVLEPVPCTFQALQYLMPGILLPFFSLSLPSKLQFTLTVGAHISVLLVCPRQSPTTPHDVICLCVSILRAENILISYLQHPPWCLETEAALRIGLVQEQKKGS